MRLLLIALLSAFSAFTGLSQAPPIEPGISQELAQWRAVRYSDVRYKLNLTLEKMSPVLKGTMEIRLQYAAEACAECPPRYIVLDWRKIRGHEAKSTIGNVSLNGKPVSISTNWPPADAGGSDKNVAPGVADFNEHLVFSDGVVMGENVIKLDFTSPILTSGSAITRYVDKEDGSEYLYSLFVPSDASTAFPVFDQPDIKARFELTTYVPMRDGGLLWSVVSNSPLKSRRVGNRYGLHDPRKGDPKYGGDIPWVTTEFAETKPISTYVFAFAAGPWERVAEPPALAGGKDSPSGSLDATTGASPPAHAGGSAFVRKSQAAKFKPHAAEVFRLNREAVKYFEEYFDYKFPFPKYDLVLIPEFPFGGMEHAGATFLRESSIIFPQEPTKNDLVSRATLIFHEAAHQWFGDTVTMRWFDDLWLKEGFATFTAYKALEKIMPEMNSWKVFYERIKQGAYQTDSTKGTTPIYQEIKNLSAAKSAYGNIVYNKAPAFLRQAEFYLGEDKFRTAVRSFLKKHEFGNATWEDLLEELVQKGWTEDELTARNDSPAGRKQGEQISKDTMRRSLAFWVTQRGLPVIQTGFTYDKDPNGKPFSYRLTQKPVLETNVGEIYPSWRLYFNLRAAFANGKVQIKRQFLDFQGEEPWRNDLGNQPIPTFVFPNYGDYGYGIFLLDEKSREYVLKNIQKEKDPFLRSMMWGALWDSVREGELDPREYVELVVRTLSTTPPAKAGTPPKQKGSQKEDESTTALLLNRVGTAMNYYMASGTLAAPVEDMLIERMRNAETLGQRITYYRAFLNIASSENARKVLKAMLKGGNPSSSEGVSSPASKNTLPTGRVSASIPIKTKDRFEIVTRLLILNDPEAAKLLAELEKTETSDDAKRYAYAARAGIATAENKAKYWNDFTNNKEISESWIEAAFVSWNSIKHSEMTLPYLQRALQELPNHKRNRKIFFVNGWLGAFIGGQRSEEALNIVNNFLADNPSLDKDLRLKILENVDLIERAVKIRARYGRN